MPLSDANPKYRFALTKAAAVVCVLGLHIAVLAAIFSSSAVKPEIDFPESVDVRFVEIAPDIVEAAANPQPVDEPVAQLSDAQPEPVVDEPEPLPEPVVEEPEPEPVVEQPEPEAITPAVPKVEVRPKIEPKPKPKPRPKPRTTPKPVARSTSTPIKPASTAAAPVGTAPVEAVPTAPAPSVDANKPRMIGKVDYLGRRPSPVYPQASLRRGETGRVVVRVLISPQGTVANVSVRTSSGHSRLDESALSAVRQARFKPYTENGVAYSAMADIPFDFVL